jgi:hypothetical protein
MSLSVFAEAAEATGISLLGMSSIWKVGWQRRRSSLPASYYIGDRCRYVAQLGGLGRLCSRHELPIGSYL